MASHATTGAVGARAASGTRGEGAGFFGTGVEGVGEAGTAADDGRNCFRFGGVEVLVGSYEDAIGARLFVVEVDGAAKWCARFRPGDGERVRGPHADGGDGDVNVLAWLNFPWPSDGEGDAEGVTWESFDGGFGATVAEVAVDEVPEAEGAVQDPGGDGGYQEGLLWEVG